MVNLQLLYRLVTYFACVVVKGNVTQKCRYQVYIMGKIRFST